MTHQELTRFVLLQLIAFSKFNQHPQDEVKTFAIAFELAKTKGIKHVMQAFKNLERYELLTTKSPIFKTISLTKKAFLMRDKESIMKQIDENKWHINLAEEKGKSEIIEKLKEENNFLFFLREEI